MAPPKNKILFFVDHEIGHQCLSWFLNSKNSTECEFKILTPPRPEGAWWKDARDLSLDISDYDHSTFKKSGLTEDVDFVFLLSWKFIFPTRCLKQVKKACINLHYSALPDYRGVYPVNWQIIKGEKKAGVTFHLVTDEIDSGPIIWQRKDTPISDSDTASSLLEKLDKVAVKGFQEVFNNLESLIQNSWAQGTSDKYFSRKDFEEFKKMRRTEDLTDTQWDRIQRGLTFNITK